MARREIGLVVFDWAGTVIDFGCVAPAGAFVEAFREQGIPVTMPEARAPMGLHKKDHIRAMLAMPRIDSLWRSILGHPWSEADVEALYARVTPMQVAAARQHDKLVPGVLECVNELRMMGVRIAGSTGYFREAADVVYEAARRQGFRPDFCICADEVTRGRPAPWMIFRCMEALDVYPPKRVVKVGDTLIDIEDGINAGVWSVAVVDSSSEMGLSEAEFIALDPSERDRRRADVRAKFEAAGADGVLTNLGELPDFIRDLNRRLTDSL